MSAPGKFQSPKSDKLADPAKFLKLAERVERTLSEGEGCLNKDMPKQVDPNKILVSPLNRLGAPPNVRHVHQGILKSFLTKAFDRTRPAIGICVEVKSEQGIKKLLAHNNKLLLACSFLPYLFIYLLLNVKLFIVAS